MERQKVRDTDNVRLFFLAHFFIEYLLILYKREQLEKGKDGEANGNGAAERILLGYAVIMVEMDSVKWVFSRMRMTMEDKVSNAAIAQQVSMCMLTRSRLDGSNCKPASTVSPRL